MLETRRARAAAMTGFRARAPIVAALALALAACSRAPEPRYHPFLRLVPEGDRGAADPSMAEVWTLELNGVRHPVLETVSAPIALTTLTYRIIPATYRGSVTFDVAIPPALQGRTVCLIGRRMVLDTPPPDNLPAPLKVAPDSGAAISTVRLDGRGRAVHTLGPAETVEWYVDGTETSGTAVVALTFGPAPTPTYVTGAIDVPERARLRFAIGIDEGDWRGVPSVTFTITALDERDEARLFRARVDPATRPADRGWVDREVDLATYGGRRIKLRLETSSEAGGDGGPPRTFPVWGDPTIVAPEPTGGAARADARRNVVLISLDTLRADHLGCYGHQRPTSPTIDAQLAARGVLFERAFAAFPQTSGSHMTMLTSLDPCVHRVFGLDTLLRPDAHTLAELLRFGGYDTAAFTEDGYLAAETGFARGFGTYVESKSRQIATGQAPETFHQGLEWIRRQRGGPWFVFLHTYQVHAPYTPPAGYFDTVAWAGGHDPLDAALYDAEIRYTDDLLAGFLAGLDELGVADRTVVVLTSDHGEHFGEHNLWGHANSLYDELLHVPLIVRAPGLVPEGKRVGGTVGLIDLVPTLLDLLGLPPPRWTQGRSLTPLLHDGTLSPVVLYAEWPLYHVVSLRQYGVAKWIFNDDGQSGSFFDLVHDSEENSPRSVFPRQVWTRLLEGFRAHCAAPPPPAAVKAPVDPAVREKLRALGYAY